MTNLSKYAPIFLSVLRIVAALLFLEHGTQKLFGFPVAMHFPGNGGLPPLFLAAGLLETFGGFLVLIGLFTRPVAFLLSGEMAIAYWMIHVPHGGIFPIANGGSEAILYCFVYLYLVFAGSGAFSVDAWRKGSKGPAAA